MRALERAIELNGVAVDAGKTAFAWGRLAAAEPAKLDALLGYVAAEADDLDALIRRKRRFLAGYQDEAYAARYEALVRAVERAERSVADGELPLAKAVARNLAKLMAYKDEYEVARLYTDGAFLKHLHQTFEGKLKLSFHLTPPFLARPRGTDDEPRKLTFGPWLLRGLRYLALLKRLRGTPFDPFGRTAERQLSGGCGTSTR